ncbi:MAG: hypothetical protein ACI8WB_001236 [Phenylobacterium sp.]|jgi:hypothetical protein
MAQPANPEPTLRAPPQYTVLFELEVKHHYFADGLCRQLAFTPAEQTRQLMHNADMLLRVRDHGFSLLYDHQSPALLATFERQSSLDFFFSVTVNAVDFGCYSKQKIVSKDQRLVVNYPGFSAAKCDPDSQAQPMELAYQDSQAQAKQGKQGEQALFGRWLNNMFLATVKLPPQTLQPLLSGSAKALPWRAVLQFDNTQRYWQYIFIGNWLDELMDQNMADNATPISIVDVAGKVQFAPLSAATLPGGIKVWTAMSAVPLPLQQVSQYQFKLCQGDNTLMGHLPVANVREQSLLANGQWVSEIYINQSKRINL